MRINGFEIVGTFIRPDSNEMVILGKRKDDHGTEYVTAIVDSDIPEPRYWFWGHYFRNWDSALADFLKRLQA